MSEFTYNRKKQTGRAPLLIVLVLGLVVAVVLGLFFSLKPEQPGEKVTDLVFNEICAKNETILADNDGRYRDYVELYNGGEDINLKGYHLSDGKTMSEPFGDLPLPAGSYCLLFVSRDLTNFSLGATGGDWVQLINPAGQIVAQANTMPLEEDQVMLYTGQEYIVSKNASPGFPNNESGYRAFKEGFVNEKPVLLISELLTENASSLPDEAGRFSDVVELHNSGSTPIYLGEYCLSDSLQNRFLYRLPAVTLDPGAYVVIFCDGENYLGENGEIHANFALSRGETLCLTGRDGSYISLDVQFPGEDISTALDDKGNYRASSVSLGFANHEIGVTDFGFSRTDAKAALVISEILLSSSDVPYNGSFVDVVEIWNRSQETVDTTGWYLSDGGDPYCYALPQKKLAPGERMVLRCSREETGFALSQRDILRLFTPDWKWASKVSCSGSQPWQSIQLIEGESEALYTTGEISLGFENSRSGVQTYEAQRRPKGLVISELMSANRSYLKGPYGATCDWVELYNASNETINLQEYCFATDSGQLGEYTLPVKTLDPGKFIVIFLSEKTDSYRSGYSVLPFNLSSRGETIYLSRGGEVVDYVRVPELLADITYGRGENGGFAVLATPTPGKTNSNAAGLSAAPVAGTKQGSYNASNLEVTLSGSGTVYYTTDCTTPSNASTRYIGPIKLTKTTVIRAICYEEGKLPSKVVDLTYVVNENDSLPVVSVVTAPENLWDYYTGIYVKGPNASSVFPYVGANYWQNWEKEASVSLMEKDGTGFSVPCGLSIFGAYSRALEMKGFSCNFRDVYGAGSLDYAIFGEEGLNSFESFVLRSSGQDNYKSRMRDVLMTSLIADYTTVAVQKYKPVVLYLNGEYWGVYYIREKAQEFYVAGNYNVAREDVVLTGANGIDKLEYKNLVNYAHSHDLSVQEYYDHVCAQIDVENYIDYIVAQIYIGNSDNGNIRYFKTPDTKWTWIMYDTDYGFADASYNSVSDHLNPNGTGANNAFSTKLINALLKNPEFKEKFIRRIAWQINNVWTKDNVWARIDELESLIKEDMKKDCTRWDRSYSTWQSHVQTLRNFVVWRNQNLPKYVKSYFGLTTAQMQEYGFNV